MRVSNSWLKELVNIEESIDDIARAMVFAGNEYESINKLCPSNNLVIGRVVTKLPHPDSDHLNVCMVDLGDKVYQIVCGAPNVDANQKVIVAKVGAKLPGGEIKQSTIRGIESSGMICSLSELGIESKYLKEKDSLGIHVLNDDAPVGIDAVEYLGLNDSYVDYELTANRGDLLSMIGMAYEVGAIYDKKVKLPTISLKEVKEKTKDNIKITNETNKCSAYLSRIVKNVKIMESPDFIKSRLMCSGIRPINNVVDISNYVMLLYGTPLHFFDYEKLGNEIIIRMAYDKEKITTLDNVERTLKDTDIVICNESSPVALAGVMGGLSTEITDNTKNILIECAIFNPYNIRYTSKEILRSEASTRFEKGIDPNIINEAIDMAAYLLQEYASGEVLNGVVGFNENDTNPKEIIISKSKINKVLGMEISNKDISDIFNRLAFTYKEKNDEYKVIVPTRRLDVNIKEDLIEEVGRIYGYDKLEGKLPITYTKNGSYLPINKYIKNIKSRLSSLCLNEVITYSLVSESDINMFNDIAFDPIKVSEPLTEDKSIMRYSLIPSLLKVCEYNLSRNIKDVNIYEISKTYYNDEEVNKLSILMMGNYIENSWSNKIVVDFYTLKGVLENLFDYLGVLNRYKLSTDNICKDFHPGISANIIIDNEIVGSIGRVHPSINKKDIFVLELNLNKLFNIPIKKIKYKEIPKYPSVVKDVAFIIDEKTPSGNVLDLIKKCGKIITKVQVFDVYKIDDTKKSIAFKITFSDDTKTLTDEEVNKTLDLIIEKVEKEFNAKLRNK